PAGRPRRSASARPSGPARCAPAAAAHRPPIAPPLPGSGPVSRQSSGVSSVSEVTPFNLQSLPMPPEGQNSDAVDNVRGGRVRLSGVPAGSHAGSHRGEQPSKTSDLREQRAGTPPRPRTVLNGSGCPYRYLRIRRLGVRVPPSPPRGLHV